MGATKNEIPRIGKARDHQDRRAVAPADTQNTGAAGYSAPDLLSLVRPLPQWWPRSAGRSPFGTEPGMEPHPRGCTGSDHRTGARSIRALPARVGRALHRQEALLRVRSHGLSSVEGP